MKKRIAVLASLFPFAIPAVAGATIVINRGMFGVSVGETSKQVRHLLGRPSEVDHRGGTTVWFYDGKAFTVDFSRDNRVHDLSTIAPSQRTATGVGVGSSETAVKRLVRGVHCSPGTEASQKVDCVVASGNLVTDFQVTSRRGRVDSVLITRKP